MGNPLGPDYTRDQSERNARRISTDDDECEPETVEQAVPESLADLMTDPTCGRRGAAA
jgi:hypothetical protein